jgi:hypothetical protein
MARSGTASAYSQTSAKMPLRTLQFVTLLFVALVMGTSFAHALEMPAKMRVPGPMWLTFQHTLYANFAIVGGVVEIGSIVTATMLAYRQRRNPEAFRLTALAALCVLVAFAVVWVGFTNPVNQRTAVWTEQSMPPDWARWRSQWEISHVVRYVLHLAAFAALLTTVTRTPVTRTT